MTNWERIRAAMAGRKTDGHPVSLWRHFLAEERTGTGLAQAMLGFQEAYDWSFMKVNPRASYHDEAWGAQYITSDDTGGKPQRALPVIREAADWAKLEVLEPDAGALGEHLEALRLIGDGLGGEVPFIMTVFTPLAVAGRLADGAGNLLAFIATDPEAVRGALDVITETFCRFSRACLDAGAAGLFLATTDFATTDCLNVAQYDEWARPYDLKVLDAVSEAPFNVLHVCRGNNIIEHLLDYPVHAFNWDAAHPANPSIAEIWAKTDKTVIGGVSTGMIAGSTADEVSAQAKEAAVGVGEGRFILGAGCTYDSASAEANVRAMRDVADVL